MFGSGSDCSRRRASGSSLYVRDSKLHFVHNYMGLRELKVSSTVDVPDGAVTLRYEFEPTTPPDLTRRIGAGGRAQLYIDGDLVGRRGVRDDGTDRLRHRGPLVGLRLRRGRHRGLPDAVPLHGVIHSATVDLSGQLIKDTEAEIAQLMAQQ